jgi:uncharacterized protein (DUF952 family)
MGFIKSEYLYKICTAAEAEAWEGAGSITGSGLDLADGFFHSSDGEMVKKVAGMFFKGAPIHTLTLHLSDTLLWRADGAHVIIIRQESRG